MCQSVKCMCGNWWQNNQNVTLFPTAFSQMNIDISAPVTHGGNNLADYSL